MQAAQLKGTRVCLEPLRAALAAELAPVLADPLLHTFIGGEPLDREQLEARYQRQVVGRSADGSQRWLNWLVRDHRDGQALGTVQATVRMQRRRAYCGGRLGDRDHVPRSGLRHGGSRTSSRLAA